jgi:hypothetical protein
MTLEMICQRSSVRMSVRKSVKNFGPIEHSARTNASAGPPNSMEMMRSLRFS